MKITLFGGNGFIGSRVFEALETYKGLDLQHFSSVEEAHQNKIIELGYVIWAAGITADFRTRLFDTFKSHVSDVNFLLKEFQIEGFLYLSSARVYSSKLGCLESSPILVYPARKDDSYNISKISGESIVLNSGILYPVVVRLSNVLGPREFLRDTFIGQICREALNGHIHLIESKHSSKDYIWIDDAISIILDIIWKKKTGIFNVCRSLNITHSEWVESICKVVGSTWSEESNAAIVERDIIPSVYSRTGVTRDLVNPISKVTDILGVRNESFR